MPREMEMDLRAEKTMPKVWETNAAEALMHLQARYAALSTMAESSIKASRVLGRSVPREFIEPYSKAVADYRRFGGELFDILAKRGLSVEQVIFRHGQPEKSKTDPNKFRTVKINAPLVPPIFTGMPGESDIGAVPLVVAGLIIGRIIVVSIVGYVVVKALHEIRIIITGPDYNPDKQADAVLRVFEGLKKGGVSPEKAAEIARQGAAPPPGSGIGLGGALLGVGALLGSAYLFTHRPQKAA